MDLDARPVPPPQDDFTDAERAVLARVFTNVDDHVFGLTDLPEVVKGALFARYSRSPKSIRRLYLDEFVPQLEGLGDAARRRADGRRGGPGRPPVPEGVQRVRGRLGGPARRGHVAVEEVSNLMTKQLSGGGWPPTSSSPPATSPTTCGSTDGGATTATPT